jgi:hypothetical protein
LSLLAKTLLLLAKTLLARILLPKNIFVQTPPLEKKILSADWPSRWPLDRFTFKCDV